jgi:hypothetical protein
VKPSRSSANPSSGRHPRARRGEAPRDVTADRKRVARERAEAQRAERGRANARKAARAAEADARRRVTRAARSPTRATWEARFASSPQVAGQT